MRKTFFVLPVVVLLALTAFVMSRGMEEQPLQLLPSGGDFTLTTADGEFSLADLRGEVALLYFGYTHCPDVCPIDLSIMAGAIERLDAGEQSQVRGLFVSVDPERDDPDYLKGYVAHFHERIIGMTGDHDALKKAASLYAAGYMVDPVPDGADPDSYTISHTASTYVIGRDGGLRERLSHGSEIEQVTTAIRRAL